MIWTPANYITVLLMVVLAMKRGRKFDFHGAFKDKAEAVRKEQEVHGFIREHTIGGHVRYFVLTVRDKEEHE